jgi:uroporphyrinogen III methyltransferase/synthase
MPPVVAGPLAGRTVVVTRSGRRARGLAEALHQAGAATIEMPLTTQTEAADGGTSLRAAAADVAQYAWVVFTSVNAVTRFMGAVRDARSLGSVEVAAVGPATGDALRAAGVEPDLVPAEQRARGLVDAFPECEGPSSGRVLFPCAEQAPPTIPDGLGLKGWAVERVETYRTVARPAPDPDTLAVAARADAVTFAASSAVTAYLALRAPGGGSLPVPPLVVCIGPTTAATARRLGLRGVHEAHGPSAEGIVAALVHHRDDGQSDGS